MSPEYRGSYIAVPCTGSPHSKTASSPNGSPGAISHSLGQTPVALRRQVSFGSVENIH